jgi:hypothetical protein
MSGAIRATKHIVTAAILMSKMNYPLKDGNVIRKLIDQAIY